MDATDEIDRRRLVAVVLDDAATGQVGVEQQHERQIAIYDLVEENVFGLPGRDDGPYALMIALHESRLALDVRTTDGASIVTHLLSLTPFRRILKDYFLICESYYAAIRTATPAQIEAMDFNRRALHDDGARILEERLAGKIETDFDTARRLFTLVAALHWRG
ncbi:MAG: UPF0262 family protein [Rhizobiales bacterium]|nr:UPF0262 family protein [Hyphomicrobiales bacterium]